MCKSALEEDMEADEKCGDIFDKCTTLERQRSEQSDPSPENQHKTGLSRCRRTISNIVTLIASISIIIIFFAAAFRGRITYESYACVHSPYWYTADDYAAITLFVFFVSFPFNQLLANTLHRHISADEADWQRAGLAALWVVLGSLLALGWGKLGGRPMCFRDAVKELIAERYPEKFRELYGLANGTLPGYGQ